MTDSASSLRSSGSPPVTTASMTPAAIASSATRSHVASEMSGVPSSVRRGESVKQKPHRRLQRCVSSSLTPIGRSSGERRAGRAASPRTRCVTCRSVRLSRGGALIVTRSRPVALRLRLVGPCLDPGRGRGALLAGDVLGPWRLVLRLRSVGLWCLRMVVLGHGVLLLVAGVKAALRQTRSGSRTRSRRGLRRRCPRPVAARTPARERRALVSADCRARTRRLLSGGSGAAYTGPTTRKRPRRGGAFYFRASPGLAFEDEVRSGGRAVVRSCRLSKSTLERAEKCGARPLATGRTASRTHRS